MYNLSLATDITRKLLIIVLLWGFYRCLREYKTLKGLISNFTVNFPTFLTW